MEEPRFLTAAANTHESRLGNHNNNTADFLFCDGYDRRVETEDLLSATSRIIVGQWCTIQPEAPHSCFKQEVDFHGRQESIVRDKSRAHLSLE